MPTTATRRTLSFTTLDLVIPEVDRLLERGHSTIGTRSLGQICHHLSQAVMVSVEGTPFKAPWLVRTVIAPVALKRILKTGRMPEGVKLPEAALPAPELDTRAEAEALRAALRYYATYTGPVAFHPLFGRIDRATWDRLHAIHCAHHLSFVLPNDPT